HVVLSTCNRVEIYFTTSDGDAIHGDLNGGIYLDGMDAVSHLFRVASGLESMSLGEHEILAQVKSSYERYGEMKRTDKLISLIFRKAISTGKMARERTSISRGKTSIPVIALDMAAGIKPIQESSVLVIGMGQMAETFLRYLVKTPPAELIIAGRNSNLGEEIARRYGGSYVNTDRLSEVVNHCDVVITATSSKSILIHSGDISRPGLQVFVDISNPINIDQAVRYIPEKVVIDLKTVESIASRNREAKMSEIPKVEAIISETLVAFSKKLIEFQAEEFITRSYSFAEEITRNEVDRLLEEIRKGRDPDEVSLKMVNSLVKKLLGRYTLTLRDAALKRDSEKLKIISSAFLDDGTNS
ncbi:MAG: glutamyl-tRNA reductase, partial [Thermoplasmataceae archaeon]